MTVSTLIDLLTRINCPDAEVSVGYTTDTGAGDQSCQDPATGINLELDSTGAWVVIR